VTDVYLLHFSRPYHHAQHYLGFTEQGVDARLAVHRAGRGSPLVAAAIAAGIEVTVARTWPGASRKDKRYLHDLKAGRRLCPICTPQEALLRARFLGRNPP